MPLKGWSQLVKTTSSHFLKSQRPVSMHSTVSFHQSFDSGSERQNPSPTTTFQPHPMQLFKFKIPHYFALKRRARALRIFFLGPWKKENKDKCKKEKYVCLYVCRNLVSFSNVQFVKASQNFSEMLP